VPALVAPLGLSTIPLEFEVALFPEPPPPLAPDSESPESPQETTADTTANPIQLNTRRFIAFSPVAILHSPI
jgi:hypothetical protein